MDSDRDFLRNSDKTLPGSAVRLPRRVGAGCRPSPRLAVDGPCFRFEGAHKLASVVSQVLTAPAASLSTASPNGSGRPGGAAPRCHALVTE